ncbi:taste receptor type 2 member 124 [Xenopus laevis]|uniref:Taste receptor type 2 n=2 Tax=Xenopus laevis TaxID=8355 RepID=A0A974C0Z1_XENLA|nr:taste receptor type 2 member 124 [Xenopus laevis]OCT64597.1 hypothetical protein XELAEV_18045696mg [Xenopus laevis]
MLSVITVIRTVMLIVTWPCGTILNSSIITVYLSDWKKGVKLGECDQISLSMGCNNLLFQCVIAFLEAFISYGLYSPIAEIAIYVVNNVAFFSFCFSFWLTAGLSICYCLRLVHFSLKFFIQLKRRLTRTVIQLLLCSVAILFMITLFISTTIWISYREGNQNITAIYHDNMSNAGFNYMTIAVTVGICLPFLITSICILLSVISLLKHIWRMKQNTQFGNPQLKNLIRACRTMILLLAQNFLSFLIFFTSMIAPNTTGTIWDMVFLLGILLNPSSQAIILIFGNSKLLSAWRNTLLPQ